MATERICTIEGCGKRHKARGMCESHYMKWRYANRDNLPQRETKAAYVQRVVLNYTGDDCLIWPFGRNSSRPEMSFNGRVSIVSRVVCELAYGPPSTPNLEAAHGCGNGHLGCVNPKHLRWATRLENMQDRALHGRSSGGRGQAKVTEAEIVAIRNDPRGHKLVAKAYGLGRSTVQQIRQRLTWKHVA